MPEPGLTRLARYGKLDEVVWGNGRGERRTSHELVDGVDIRGQGKREGARGRVDRDGKGGLAKRRESEKQNQNHHPIKHTIRTLLGPKVNMVIKLRTQSLICCHWTLEMEPEPSSTNK